MPGPKDLVFKSFSIQYKQMIVFAFDSQICWSSKLFLKQNSHVPIDWVTAAHFLCFQLFYSNLRNGCNQRSISKKICRDSNYHDDNSSNLVSW